jgi:hypothetical protein
MDFHTWTLVDINGNKTNRVVMPEFENISIKFHFYQLWIPGNFKEYLNWDNFCCD